ncbi:outer membrane protein [Tabrizicola sp. BL-A-41-H6]|uniref:outer membrane protein n=1 Tax=Tabrizicola sp. BL-A-41-H6 TaxID=3421107 RepID=UPI003D66CD5C
MKTSILAAAALAGLAAPSFAGGPIAVAEEPVTVAPAAPVAQPVDWSGPYAGLSFGIGSGDTQTEGESADYDDGNVASILAGYNFQSGNLVYGAELGYSSVSDMVLVGDDLGGDDTFDSMIDLRGRVGYSAGKALIYGALGYAWGETTINGSDSASADGVSLGLGVDYLVSDQIFLGLDYTSRNLSGTDENPDNTFDFDATVNTVSFRVGMSF